MNTVVCFCHELSTCQNDMDPFLMQNMEGGRAHVVFSAGGAPHMTTVFTILQLVSCSVSGTIAVDEEL